MNPSAPVPVPGRRVVLGVLWVTFVVTVLYWVVWFGVNREWLASAHTAEYFAFENAFPLADAWLALTALLGALALHRSRPTTVLWLPVCGSASLYLACMDILFDLENGIYRAPTGDVGGVVAEIIINAFTLVCGVALMAWAWRHRSRWLAPQGASAPH